MTNAVEAEGLEKTFGGKVRALDGVSFAVEEGTVFGLLGPNGAGKSTAVRILTTILRPDAGVARVLAVAASTRHGMRNWYGPGSAWPASSRRWMKTSRGARTCTWWAA